MSGPLRECTGCETLNHLDPNPVKCWNCGLTWAEQGGRLGRVTGGP